MLWCEESIMKLTWNYNRLRVEDKSYSYDQEELVFELMEDWQNDLHQAGLEDFVEEVLFHYLDHEMVDEKDEYEMYSQHLQYYNKLEFKAQYIIKAYDKKLKEYVKPFIVIFAMDTVNIYKLT